MKLPVPKKKQKAEPKSKGRGKGGKGCGKGGRSACGRGRGRGRGCNTSSEISTNGFNSASVTAPPRPRGRRGRGNTTQQRYSVPNYVAVVKQKGFNAPEDPLAVQLAKYFQEKTEIKYNMIVDKMKDVPEDDILRMLGIDPNKETDNNNAKEADDKETNEKEADAFMKELSSSAESEKQGKRR